MVTEDLGELNTALMESGFGPVRRGDLARELRRNKATQRAGGQRIQPLLISDFDEQPNMTVWPCGN